MQQITKQTFSANFQGSITLRAKLQASEHTECTNFPYEEFMQFYFKKYSQARQKSNTCHYFFPEVGKWFTIGDITWSTQQRRPLDL